MSQNFYVSVAKNSQEAIECFRNSEENSTLYGSGLCRLNGLEVEKFREKWVRKVEVGISTETDILQKRETFRFRTLEKIKKCHSRITPDM